MTDLEDMSMPNAWNGKVESISQEGLGVGTIKTFEDGKTLRRPIFIPFTVPGDEIDAQVEREPGVEIHIVLDNLSAHKPARVRELIEERGCELIYLPAYSPDLNPIEEAFAKINTSRSVVSLRVRLK